VKIVLRYSLDIKESSFSGCDQFPVLKTSNYLPNNTASHPKHMDLQQHHYKNLQSFWFSSIIFQADKLTVHCKILHYTL